MIKGKTKTGFEYQIGKDTLNNYEMLENISELEENPLLITKIANQLLGKNLVRELKEHVRNDKGIISINRMSEEITDIFQNGNQETKNS